EVADLARVVGVGEVDHRHSALVPRLDHDVLARDGDEPAVVGHAVLLPRLLPGDLEVAVPYQPAVRGDLVDRVGALRARGVGGAGGGDAAAELVGEDDVGGVVAEGRRVPDGEVLGVGALLHPPGPYRVGDVHQDAVAQARARREVLVRIGGDVMAAGGVGF